MHKVLKGGITLDLYILLDVSGSMADLVDDGKKGIKRKIDIVREHILSFLSDNHGIVWSGVHLYTFSTVLTHIHSFVKHEGQTDDGRGTNPKSVVLTVIQQRRHIMDARRKIEDYNFACSGGTKIWDSIHAVITSPSMTAPTKVICVTDGEDGGSSNTYADIAAELKRNAGLELVILDIEGSLKKKRGDIIIKTANTPQAIKKVLQESIFTNMPARHVSDRLDISVPVIPVIPCSDDELTMVRNAVQDAVPYIEELTGLRYYPVPTYIVDEYVMKKMIEEPFPEPGNNELLRYDIMELLRFYQIVAYKICQGAFYPSVNEPDKHESWGRYFVWSEDSRDTVFSYCEGCLGVFDFIENGQFGCENVYHLPELSHYEDDISKFYAVSKELINYLMERNEIHGDQSRGIYVYVDTDIIVRTKEVTNPNLDVWERHLSPGDFNKLQKCLEENGNWRKELTSVITVFKLMLPVLIELLRKWELFSLKWYKVAREMHTYGVYLHRSSENNPKLVNLLKKNGYPEQFARMETGKVLLCLERCKNRMERLSEEELSELQSSDELLPRLLQATLIHEHAHAITYEGIGNGTDTYFNNSVGKGGKKYRAVTETIAEWAELNYFHVKGDKDLSEIIKSHSRAGSFPEWPYAGALILEYSENDIHPEVNFRTLLNYFRSNTNTAYKLLQSWI